MACWRSPHCARMFFFFFFFPPDQLSGNLSPVLVWGVSGRDVTIGWFYNLFFSLPPSPHATFSPSPGLALGDPVARASPGGNHGNFDCWRISGCGGEGGFSPYLVGGKTPGHVEVHLRPRAGVLTETVVTQQCLSVSTAGFS